MKPPPHLKHQKHENVKTKYKKLGNYSQKSVK